MKKAKLIVAYNAEKNSVIEDYADKKGVAPWPGGMTMSQC